MQTLSPRALNRATLARQQLLTRSPISALDAIERLAGLQAQQAKPPFIGLWTRLEGFQQSDLRGLLLDRQVVRATTMRGTLHLMSASDYLLLRSALQPGLTKGMQAILRDRASSLDLAELTRLAHGFFLEEARTFDELRDYLLESYPQGDERAMAYAVRTHLPLVQVPTDTAWGYPASADFTVADAWLGKAPDPESHVQTLVKRYLAAFGPASVADAQTWSGLSGLKPVFDALKAELVCFKDAFGKVLFDLPDAPRPPEETEAPVRFLPDFDNLVLAHADRTRFIATEHRPRIVTKNLQVLATFMVDGVVSGTWSLTRKKGMAILTLKPFVEVPHNAREALADEAARLVSFIEPEATSHDLRVE